jgi:hypothetical protein
MSELIYIATPYSHSDSKVQQERFDKVNRFSAGLMGDGLYVFSPISHAHPIAEVGCLPKGWDFWSKYDRLMISKCTKLIVFMQDGWKESTGVQAEIKIAEELGIPVEYAKDSI